ncbi:Chymotrypsinogen B [Pseudolycoriella hygida]|uniref:Chymotrypsinogen B n=1 Tax=Pseudolycoriella hygida TaxID=35572 RepID=A0A9Q0MN11_9DIPT|nr:Chymotrypsinogen B [Pseudolycoriella hygida]
MLSLQTNTAIFLFCAVVFIQIGRKNAQHTPCGRRIPGPSPLMLGAYNAERWPWHAAIYYKGELNCGGTLISENSVRTAGHCVTIDGELMATTDLVVWLGRYNLHASERSAQQFEVGKILEHPQYCGAYLRNDIAILRLSTDAVFNEFVRPICLWPSHKIELSEVIGQDGTVVGWGETEKKKSSAILKQASMRIVDSIDCLRSDSSTYGIYLTQNNFCAGYRNGTSVCRGDSGGSLVLEQSDEVFYIRGIVSATPVIIEQGLSNAGNAACDSMKFAIFTDVAQYLPWIRDNIKYCKKTVQCQMAGHQCNINIEFNELNCKLIFTLDSSKGNVRALKLTGDLKFQPDLSDAVAKFEHLKEVTFYSDFIEVLDRSKFTPLSNIESLTVGFTNIHEITAHTFDDLTNLLKLVIIRNILTKIDSNIFDNLLNLEVIFLYNNNFADLPRGLFKNNSKLKHIDLSLNRISNLSEFFFEKHHNLERLIINTNELSTLHENIFRNNQNLKQISLSFNKIHYLPRLLFRNNPKLEDISFESNDITEIPEGFFDENRDLEIIDFGANKLTILPENLFRNNQKLKSINFYDNKIMKIATNFQNLPKLIIISFRNNDCISEVFYAKHSHGTPIGEMQRKLWEECPV